MTIGEIILFVIALAVMLVGLAGVILPVLPGAPLIFAAVIGYGALTGFESLSKEIIITLAILTGVSLLLDWLPGIVGVKKFGGSVWGVTGSMVGMLAGLFVGGVIGMVVLSFVGAVVGEILAGRKNEQAFRAGAGSFIGFFFGVVAKFTIGSVMIGIFAWQVLFH
ncbi:MAG: DUF456 domain-containing protein [Patescibacteria group bacterium]